MNLGELIESERQNVRLGPSPDLCRVGRVLDSLSDEEVQALDTAAVELTWAAMARILTRIDGSTVSWSATQRHYEGGCCCG